MKNDLDHRLARIEAHVAHMEKHHDELNQVIIEQGKLLKKLQAQMRRVTDALESTELDRIKSNNPKPPHYQ